MAIFDATSRQAVLGRLLTELHSDDRIAGVLLVGSAARGFEDDYSDIDLAVVVREEQEALAVFRDWRERIEAALPVLWCFTDVRGPQVGLYAFILRDYLEVDVSFQSPAVLSARSASWSIAFDRTSGLADIMERSWSERSEPDPRETYLRRLDSIWHYITHVAVSLKRGHLWRAIHYLEEIRNRTIELEGLERGLIIRHFRQVDRLPPERLRKLEGMIPRALIHEEITCALRVATECFFDVAGRFDEVYGLEASRTLKRSMDDYLNWAAP